MEKNKKNILGFLILLLVTTCHVSCNQAETSKDDDDQQLIINEIMASNRTGITARNGKLYDWIEIKNASSSDVNLKDYSLLLEKSEKEGGEKITEKKEWHFPDSVVKSGEFIVVFASKKDNTKHKGELHASFKLPSTGGKVQLKRDTVIVCETKYTPLENDQSYRLVDNNKYEKTYEVTPGFDNTREGYEQYNTALDKMREGPLRMWELHAKGRTEGLAWVEIKNVSDQPVSLQNYSLTTSTKDLKEFTFPQVELQPGQVYVVESQNERFKINSSKSVMLTCNGKFVDGICANPAPLGMSVGRVNGKSGLYYFPSPTRGSENTTSHYRFMAQEPTFSLSPGIHSKEKSLKVALNTHGHTVHYTTDGSIPTSQSPIYKDSIKIDTATTIRAYCEGDSVSTYSNTVTGTFILAEAHTLPVMNITVKHGDLYDYNTGIYVEGPKASPTFPHVGANYWQKWWKNAHVEFFDGGEGFSAECEIGIFGGFSRGLAKKSFKIRFKNVNGPSHILYDLYGEGTPAKHKTFVLRSGSQDIKGVMVRDEFFTSLMKQQSPELLVQAYRPIALYINGGYFGLYYIREKIDKHYGARHFDIPSDSVEVATGNSGKEIMAYVGSHNLALKENYDFMQEHYNVIGIIDHKLGEMYASNTDIGNFKHLLTRGVGGTWKWHPVYYDIDNSWAINAGAATYFSAAGGAKRALVNRVVSSLLKNSEFRTLLLERLSYHMHHTFTPENTTAVFDQLINTIKPEMKRNCARWPQVLTYAKWEKNVEAFREKFQVRNKTMLNDLRSFLSITEEENKKYFADLGY